MSDIATNGEFTLATIFHLDEGTEIDLKVMVTHTNATGQFETVTFSDRNRGAMVSVPSELWDRIVAAVERHREF